MTITASLSSNYSCFWIVISIACITGGIFWRFADKRRQPRSKRGARSEKRERMQVIICIMCYSSIMTYIIMINKELVESGRESAVHLVHNSL